uniref:Liprin-alpha-1 (Trinotate prediction) n=1 Tax=Henneguya salminicola TaxID=69463 RepID=A0A6G3ME29_HENSL
MTGSKLESLKPLWEAILKKIPFNQWTNSVYICWLKNFILFPPEVIPDALEIIKTMKYKSFNMKKEFKKRKKRNQIQSLKVILAVKEIIDHLALNLAKIDNIMYLNKCMHHIWLSNVFLTHIGLPHLFSIFHEYLIDSRILEAMDEDNYKYYLKLSSRYQRKCLYYGVEFLKSIHFDRKNFDEIIHKEEEYMDEIKFWSNNRFLRWLSTYLKIDPILTSVLNSSGICGFIIYYQPNETSAYLKDILHQYFDNEKMHNFILEFENLTRYLYPQKMISQ